MNKGLMRRYFVELGLAEGNSGVLGAYFGEMYPKGCFWGPFP